MPDGNCEQLNLWAAAASDFLRKRLDESPEQVGESALAAVAADLADAGFASVCADEAVAGLGEGVAALAALLEPICRHDATLGSIIYATAAAHLALRRLATAENPLPPEIAGQWLAWPAFHELAEQQWPSLDESGRLNGKATGMLAPLAAAALVLPAWKGGAGLELVLVGLDLPGVSPLPQRHTLGLRGAGLVDVEFADAPVWWRAEGLAREFPALQEDLAVAGLAMLCGIMAGSLQTAFAYTGERRQGGCLIREWGEVQRLLSRMQELTQVGYSLWQHYLLAPAAADGRACQRALLHVAGLATDLTDLGIQLLGGNGYMKDYGQEKRFRDARQLASLGGSPAWRRQLLMDGDQQGSIRAVPFR
jgi:alkylation response protein AidB-like acyl-CoA dehydrogenase